MWGDFTFCAEVAVSKRAWRGPEQILVTHNDRKFVACTLLEHFVPQMSITFIDQVHDPALLFFSCRVDLNASQ